MVTRHAKFECFPWIRLDTAHALLERSYAFRAKMWVAIPFNDRRNRFIARTLGRREEATALRDPALLCCLSLWPPLTTLGRVFFLFFLFIFFFCARSYQEKEVSRGLKEKFGLFVNFKFFTEMGSWGTD